MQENLKEKAIKGIVWNIVELVGIQGIKFIVGVILARVLLPSDFGLIGMITIFFAIAQVFIDSGFGQAYIQKKNVTDLDANSVFFTNLAISVLLFLILYFAAPYIAQFYSQHQLLKLTRVMAIVLIINAIGIIQLSKITRSVNFKHKTIVSIIASVFSGGIAIYLALSGMGVWSLVILQLINRSIITIGVWIITKWTPKLQFSFSSFKEMYSYGFWLLSSSIILRFFDNIYLLIIGKFFSANSLGFYTKGKQFKELASQQLISAVSNVSFPIFTKNQTDNINLKISLRNFNKTTMFINLPILIALIILSKPFIVLLLTEKWLPLVPYLQLLCITGIFYPINIFNLQVLLAKGKSKSKFKLEILKNTLRVISIIFLYKKGIIAIIYGEIAVSIIGLFINTYYTKILINYNLFSQLKDISKTIAITCISGLITFFATIYFVTLHTKFILGCLIFSGSYLILQYLFNKELLMNIYNTRLLFLKRN
jgi:O-antigen/teichoic acid export membrane protein